MKQRASGQSGYILALNLAVLALMLIGASYVGQRVFDAIALAHAERDTVDAAYALESARSRVLLMLGSASRLAGGLGTDNAIVTLDGREYRMGDDVIVSLQDMRGLFSLNGGDLGGRDRARLERLLRTWGLPEGQMAALVDSLLDYRDADDLRRINGAEKAEYRGAGLESELRNGELLSPTELARVWGWSGADALWKLEDSILDHVSIQRGATFNPNTASWRTLAAMAGLDNATAQSIVATRRQRPRADITALLYGEDIGDPFGPLAYVSPFAGPAVVVTLRGARAPWAERWIVTHTPAEFRSPWRISAAWRMPLPMPAVPIASLPELPPAAALRDANAVGQIKF
jgi:hypothetical protein